LNPLVVIIDDDLDLLHLVKRHMERADLSWRTFPLGRPAIEWLNETEETIAVVVVDLGLPDISGFELCAELRANTATAGYELIVMSARDGLDTEARVSEYDVAAYLKKPLRARTFLDASQPLVDAAKETP
jgi:two-component system phosphate regulon response regulator PhoB